MLGFLLSIGLAAAASLPAQDTPDPPTGQSPSPQRVVIPFNPPLGETLAYRFSSRNTQEGRPATSSINIALTFRRDGAGYVLGVVIEIPPGAPQDDPLAALLRQPIYLRVNAEGVITAIVDEERYWTMMDRLTSDLTRAAGGDARAAETVRRMMARIRTLSEADRVAIFTQKYRPLFEFASTEMEIGESIEARLSGETALGQIEQHVTISLNSVDGDSALFRSVSRIAPEEMARLVSEFQRRAGVPRRRGDDEAAALPPERRDSYRVSLRTGLTERYESEVVTVGATPQIVKTEVLERLRQP